MTTETFDPTHQTLSEIKCRDCAAVLKFNPGTKELKCEYCGAANEIKTEAVTQVVENDYLSFLNEQFKSEDLNEIATVKCQGCGASTTLKPNVTSSDCPFCGLALVVTAVSSTKQIKPKYLLPFKIDQKTSFQKFKSWLSSLWFAPSDLKKKASDPDKLHGVYIPYWTYDSNTTSAYSGERGDNYTTTETYTAVENGRSVTRTRNVTKIRWTPASGRVANKFDDVLVAASNNLPTQHVRALEPWDLKNLENFNENFLTGFQTESYQLDLKNGFETAKGIMAETITVTIKRDIGGDHQRVHQVNTSYADITFKHILLPLWISAFRYGNKVYRFMVNARTGEVSGERPWSVWKITGAVLLVLAGIAAAAYFGNR